MLIEVLAILIRGLYEAWSRMTPSNPLRALIEQYVTVQVGNAQFTMPSHYLRRGTYENGALIELASNDNNKYSPSWHGPPPQTVLPRGHLAAIDTLNSAMGFATRLVSQQGCVPTIVVFNRAPSRTHNTEEQTGSLKKPGVVLPLVQSQGRNSPFLSAQSAPPSYSAVLLQRP